jgi:hypothetical protein
MSSQRKIDSARANGARSNGPVTDAGKRASSQNSLRHGFRATAVVLEGESRERFEELQAGLMAEFQPRTTTEVALVETMAAARWRHMRMLDIQKAGFDLEMARQATPSSPAYRAAVVFKNLADSSRVLDVLQRYEVSFDRQFCRALNLLLKLRSVKTVQAVCCEVERASSSITSEEKSIFPSEPNPKIEHLDSDVQSGASTPPSRAESPSNNPVAPVLLSNAAFRPDALEPELSKRIDTIRTIKQCDAFSSMAPADSSAAT